MRFCALTPEVGSNCFYIKHIFCKNTKTAGGGFYLETIGLEPRLWAQVPLAPAAPPAFADGDLLSPFRKNTAHLLVFFRAYFGGQFESDIFILKQKRLPLTQKPSFGDDRTRTEASGRKLLLLPTAAPAFAVGGLPAAFS